MDKRNIVVLGAGFGGLRTAMLMAKKLRKQNLLQKYNVVLIDRNDCHLYTPLLYKLAAASESAPQCTYDITSLIAGLPIQFIQAGITAIDLVNGMVHLDNNQSVKTDFVVLAMGSETNDFGIQGLKENALQLKSAEQGLAIRTALLALFAKQGQITIAVGGAGANGIELAAEIKVWADEEQKKNPSINMSVNLVEAMPTILTGFDTKLVAGAANRLAKIGVNVLTSAKITSVVPNKIMLDGGKEVPFELFIWTGGIKTPDLLTTLPLEQVGHGIPLARPSMMIAPAADAKLYPMVYGLGDSVAFINPKTDRRVPAVARVAILQADVVAHNIIEDAKRIEDQNYRQHYIPFVAGEYPYVIPITDGWAIAKLGPFVFSDGVRNFLANLSRSIIWFRSCRS